MTNHKTKFQRRSNKAEFCRSKAKTVFELEPTDNCLFMAGVIIDNLKRIGTPVPQVRNIEQLFIDELRKWQSYEKYIKLAWAFADLVKHATGGKVYIDCQMVNRARDQRGAI
jgi:hypothetical protein